MQADINYPFLIHSFDFPLTLLWVGLSFFNKLLSIKNTFVYLVMCKIPRTEVNFLLGTSQIRRTDVGNAKKKYRQKLKFIKSKFIMKKILSLLILICGFAYGQKQFSISDFFMITKLTKSQMEAKYEMKPVKETKDAKGNKTYQYLIEDKIREKKANYKLTIYPDKNGNIIKSQLYNDEEIRHEIFGDMNYITYKNKIPNVKWSYIDEKKIEIPYFSSSEFSNAFTEEHSKVGTYRITITMDGAKIDYLLSPTNLTIFNTKIN